MAAQREEEDAKKLYDEFVTSFGDEPEQKGSQRSFKRGGVIQPGSSASGAGSPTVCTSGSPLKMFFDQGQTSVILSMRTSSAQASWMLCRAGPEEACKIRPILFAPCPCGCDERPIQSSHRSGCCCSCHQLTTQRGEHAGRQTRAFPAAWTH